VLAAPDLPPGGLAWTELLELVAADGLRLRGALWHGGARGLAVILPGRTEFIEKWSAVAADLVRRGFTVACIDWRGQGRSERLIEPALKGHVGTFTDYLLDLDALLAHPSVAAVPGPRLLLGHSMGGTVALGALLRRRAGAQAIVLSAPMMGIVLAPWLRPVRGLTLAIARGAGQLESWPPFGRMDRPYIFSGFEGNVLTSDRELFDWMAAAIRQAPELQLAMPTLGWMDAAYREMDWLAGQGPPGCPTLWLVGSEERVVEPAAVHRAAARTGGQLAEIAGARHELLAEAEPMRGRAWEAIDRFLERSGF
jgi:lysophospholipase